MAVLKKVKQHPMFQNFDEAELQNLAEEYVDRAKIKEKFDHLLNVETTVEDIREGDDCDLTHSLEHQRLREQQKVATAIAAHLPVKLYLSRLKRGTPPLARRFTALLRFEYGPLHAGLIIGNICVEWDDSSLIVPQFFDQPAVDFQAHCDDGWSWKQRTGQLVKDMSMANRQKRSTHEKLEIIYRTRAEKEALIDRLVEVIVEYNKCKKYSVWTCNCQHFVKDAMRALGIRRTPQFEGSLNGYLEGLIQGKKIRGQLQQFGSHAELDAYVTANMKTLEKHEKEYLLCMYFQFHMIELKELTEEQQEIWECGIESCQCAELEAQIQNEHLYLEQYRQGGGGGGGVVAATSPVSVPPTVAPILEEESVPEGAGRNGGVEVENSGELSLSLVQTVQEHLDRRDSLDDQKRRLSGFTGYSVKVKSKLQNHPKCSRMSEMELEELGERLSEREKFREAYFSSYIDNFSMELISDDMEDKDRRALTDEERQQRLASRFTKLVNLQIKLILHAPHRRSSGRSSAVTARSSILMAVQVGEYIFEWDESGLVLPVELQASVRGEPLLLSPVQQQSRGWCEEVGKHKVKVQQSIHQCDYTMQIDLKYELTKKKDNLLMGFIDTVVRFNRNYTYHSRTCNHQSFVTEALRSLGIEPADFKLSKSIKEHIAQLRPSKNLSRRSTRTHQELDTVAVGLLSGTSGTPSQGDVQYLIAKYFLFHVSAWEKDQKGERSPEEWKCLVPGCKLGDLEQTLEELATISSI